jgi:hypothetical protein
MAERDISYKLITAGLIIIVAIAVITILYVNLSQENKKSENRSDITNGEVDTTTVLSLMYNDKMINFTQSDLEDLERYKGSGRYIKTGWLPTVKIDGPYNFTGIRITMLINQFGNPPENYNIIVESSDGLTSEYTYDETQGTVSIYNETGNITGTDGVTMIIAYKQDDEYLTYETDGPLRVAFVNNGKITSSRLWAKWVVSIEIIELE